MKTRLTVDIIHEKPIPPSASLVMRPKGTASMVDIVSEQTLVDGDDCEHPIDNWTHQLFDGANGPQDSYYCGSCGELMQVG